MFKISLRPHYVICKYEPTMILVRTCMCLKKVIYERYIYEVSKLCRSGDWSGLQISEICCLLFSYHLKYTFITSFASRQVPFRRRGWWEAFIWDGPFNFLRGRGGGEQNKFSCTGKVGKKKSCTRKHGKKIHISPTFLATCLNFSVGIFVNDLTINLQSGIFEIVHLAEW